MRSPSASVFSFVSSFRDVEDEIHRKQLSFSFLPSVFGWARLLRSLALELGTVGNNFMQLAKSSTKFPSAAAAKSRLEQRVVHTIIRSLALPIRPLPTSLPSTCTLASSVLSTLQPRHSGSHYPGRAATSDRLPSPTPISIENLLRRNGQRGLDSSFETICTNLAEQISQDRVFNSDCSFDCGRLSLCSLFFYVKFY